MLSNDDFVKILEDSFHKYIETSARSNEKLKILHGAISTDLKERLNSEYSISSLGIGNGKEELVLGRYIDKRVDITIKRNDKPIAGVAVKFVMSNYSQNSNNYFENMLGETANIRCSDIAYFQVFILLQNMPYFEKGRKWEGDTIQMVS